MELTESYSCNGWLIGITSELNVGLSECIFISNDYETEEDTNKVTSIGRAWTNIHNYQIVSPLYCILEDGYYDFYLAE